MQPLKDVYDQRYAGDYRHELSGHEVARWEALEHFATDVLALNGARRVLDYGAGVGLHVGLWDKIFPSAELSFCDISSVAQDKFRARFPAHAEKYALIENGRAGFDDHTFDVVASVEVMEHVEDLAGYLGDIRRLLKPGGTFLWTTPCANEFSIEHALSKLAGRIEPTHEGYRRWSWEDPTHLRRLRSREIAEVLQRSGFEAPQFRFRSHLFSFLCTYAPPRRLLKTQRERLMTLDYRLFRRLPNGASMLGAARAR